MKIKKINRLFVFLICTTLALSGCNSKMDVEEVPSFQWVESNEGMDLSWSESVGAKRFPDGNLIEVNSYGAVNDTSKMSTQAIQAAIDFCSTSGGGTVTFKPGNYLTGALFVKKGVNLHIPKNVTLFASTNIQDYPESRTRIAGIEMDWPAAVINIIDTKNAALTGEGTIDCRGKVFWDKYWDMRREYEEEGLRWIVDYDCKRVRGILISNSSDVTLRGFMLIRTGFWGIQVLYSNNCTLEKLTINNNIGGHGPSTDGIDIDSSSRILVENCDIDCNDDNICLKAGRDADGLRVNRPTEYVVIRNCTVRKGAGLITCGSETSGGIRNILGYNLRAYGTTTVLRLKSAMNRGGFIENIYVSGVVADSVKTVFISELNWNPSYSYPALPERYSEEKIPDHWKVMLTPIEPKEKGYPNFQNVYLANVKATNSGTFILTSGMNDSLRLENFELYNLDIQADNSGKIAYTDDFKLKNISLKTNGSGPIIQENNNNLDMNVSYE